MSQIKIDPASWRDPDAQIFSDDQTIFRVVKSSGFHDFQQVRQTSILPQLIERGWLLGEEEVTAQVRDQFPEAAAVLRHPRLPLITYPYEWCFDALKEAALHHLHLHQFLLREGVNLKDASAYNIQFQGTKPIFMDHGSFIPYQEGVLWHARKQFVEQFLFPLLWHAYHDASWQSLYRAQSSGIRARQLTPVLPWTRWLKPRLLSTITLPALLQVQRQTAVQLQRTFQFPKPQFERTLAKLEAWITTLKPRVQKTPWGDYTPPMSEAAQLRKQQVIQTLMSTLQPNWVLDLGCHAGDYAQLALSAGAKQVVGFEKDPNACNAAFRLAQRNRLAFWPLCVDVLNLTPQQGFALAERRDLLSRLPQIDCVIALALIHHFVLVESVPLSRLIPWLISLAPCGVIEFVKPEDPEVAAMLALNPAQGAQYHLDHAIEVLQQHAQLDRVETLGDAHRVLLIYSRAHS